jgi:nicotinate-nucleotide adenylyltransferase
MGGVFNPPHIGHVICACEALDQMRLDVVRLVPARRAPHRAIEPEPGAEVRAELCERAIAGLARLEVSRVELQRETGPSYTIDTLRAMREASPEDELFLILGGDQARALASWREPREVATLATLVVAEREGAGRESARHALAGLGVEAEYLDMPRIGISSTLVRGRVGASRPYRHLVPPGVADLIDERGLYASFAPGAAA